MTQPTLSTYFGVKKTNALGATESGNDVSSIKRPLETATTTVINQQDGGEAPEVKKIKETKKTIAGIEESSSNSVAAVDATTEMKTAYFPEPLASHPVLEPVPCMDEGWRNIIINESKKSYFPRLMDFLIQEIKSKQTIYPAYPLVFNALRLCRWEDVRVVIIGQDPYHGPNQAHGLAFSVLPPTPPPPSLLNMYKEAVVDIGMTKPNHGNLEHWSRQGVLLLNTVLTVRRGQAHSHKGRGWETFTDAVIRELDSKKDGLVFLLWGKPAQEKCKFVNKSKHRIIACAHPSPLSATKTSTPFIGSKSFSRANQALEALGKSPIDWHVPPTL